VDTLTSNVVALHASRPHPGLRDPAVVALVQLLASEREEARIAEPALVERADPSRLWLLWFAIGATVEVCELVRRAGDDERNEIFRHVIRVIFDGGAGRTDAPRAVTPEIADRSLIGLFESAGAEAVRSCMRGEPRLGYYLEALRASSNGGG
jgi:hypothetical protein